MSAASRTLVRLLLSASVGAMANGASAGSPPQASPPALIDVPYLAQTPELCGGAAVAMVLRYWGARDIFPEDFAPLVGRHAGGIRTDVLADAIRARGWQAVVLPADNGSARARLQAEVDRGRPLIALIEVAPQAYHYVVILGSTAAEVVLHDPARAPFRVTPWAEFDRAWAAAGRWLLLTLPVAVDGPRPAPPSTPSGSAPASLLTTPCTADVERAVALARGGDPQAARRILTAATLTCPDDPAPWRELAGLRFAESNWPDAEALALAAIRRGPADAYAWQIIAASRFLTGNRLAALDAWNRIDEPRVDLVGVQGADRTPHPVVVRAVGLHPRQLLSSAAFERARRRLDDLPVAYSSRLQYTPGADTSVSVAASIAERPLVPRGWMAVATFAGRALVQHDVRIDVAGALDSGEVATGSWRWSTGRPRVALGIAFPSPSWLPGVSSFDWSWERQSYAGTAADLAVARFTRRRAAFQISDWWAGWARWEIGTALDRFGTKTSVGLETAIDLRLADDRVAVVTSAGWWTPLGDHDRFSTGGVLGAWRSTGDGSHAAWSAVTEFRVASRRAPLDLWHGAGAGQGRSGLLRAHPLLDDGVFVGPVFGRVVARASVEYARPVAQAMGGGLALAGFLDTARAWARLNGLERSPLYVDAGIGLRARAPGQGGTIRLDVAHGLRGGGTTVSAGWGAAWPR